MLSCLRTLLCAAHDLIPSFTIDGQTIGLKGFANRQEGAFQARNSSQVSSFHGLAQGFSTDQQRLRFSLFRYNGRKAPRLLQQTGLLGQTHGTPRARTPAQCSAQRPAIHGHQNHSRTAQKIDGILSDGLAPLMVAGHQPTHGGLHQSDRWTEEKIGQAAAPVSRLPRIATDGEDFMSDRIALVEDDPGGRRAAAAILSRAGFDVRTFTSAEDFLKARPEVAVVLTDLMMPGIDGIELMQRIKSQHGADVEVVLITAYGSADVAAQAMSEGAFHFLTKPLDSGLLVETTRRACERVTLRSRVALLENRLATYEPAEIIGASRAVDDLKDQLKRLAPAALPVLITGPSGSGKELAARALHQGSERASQAFVAVNCAALPEHLLESELFGHLRGAFTGAEQRRKGRFLEADGGTLFLDEVADLPLSLQAKLLRALERGEITPLGADKPKQVDVRLVAATNHPSLKTALREDLYYRLAGALIEVPSLAQRHDDIPILVAHFMARHGLRAPQLGPQALEQMQRYEWPGNIRELAHACDRLAALYPGAQLDQLPEALGSDNKPLSAGLLIDPNWTLEHVESQVIQWTLDRYGGNRNATAKHLGIGVRTLYRRLQQSEDS
jgi:DNA-binding NtrC family response regulator